MIKKKNVSTRTKRVAITLLHMYEICPYCVSLNVLVIHFFMYINVPRKVISNKTYSHCVTHTVINIFRRLSYFIIAN